MYKAGVDIIGDPASFNAALGSASASTVRFGEEYKAQFAGMSDATLQLAVAQDRLAISTTRFGVGTTGAGAAMVAYNRQVASLANAQLDAASKLGRGLTTYLALPAAIIGAAAVKMGVSFQQQMLSIQTQAGASATEVQQLTGKVLAFAQAGSAQGPEQLAQGLYHLESIGLRGATAMDVLKTSSVAAGMGMANLEDVTTALGGAVVTGIRGTQNYTQAMGTLNAIVGAGNMRMEDLAQALSTGVLPAGKNAGLSLTEVGAAMAVLTDRGMQADLAGTRLRMTFSLMQDPSNKAVDALKAMGINADDLGKKLRGPNGLGDVLQELHDGMARVGAAQGSKDILGAFGGGRSGAGILTLVQSLDSSVSSYQGKLAQIQATSGNFASDQAAYFASDSYKLHAALSSVEADMIKFGQSITPTVIVAAEGVEEIANAFEALPKAIKEPMAVVAGTLAIGGPILFAVAGVAKGVRMIGTAFEGVPRAALPAVSTTSTEVAGLTKEVEAMGPAADVATEQVVLGLTQVGEAATVSKRLLQQYDAELVEMGAAAEGVGVATGEVNALGAAAQRAEIKVAALGGALEEVGPEAATGAAGAETALEGVGAAAIGAGTNVTVLDGELEGMAASAATGEAGVVAGMDGIAAETDLAAARVSILSGSLAALAGLQIGVTIAIEEVIHRKAITHAIGAVDKAVDSVIPTSVLNHMGPGDLNLELKSGNLGSTPTAEAQSIAQLAAKGNKQAENWWAQIINDKNKKVAGSGDQMEQDYAHYFKSLQQEQQVVAGATARAMPSTQVQGGTIVYVNGKPYLYTDKVPKPYVGENPAGAQANFGKSSVQELTPQQAAHDVAVQKRIDEAQVHYKNWLAGIGAPPPPKAAGDRRNYNPADNKSGIPGGEQPLTKAQQIAVGLASDPDNQNLLNQQIAADNSALKWLNKRRAEGKIANDDYVKAYKALTSDREQAENTISSLQSKAAEAAKTAAAAAAKAADYTIPENLQVAQAQAQTTTSTADDVKVAKEIKANAEARLHAGQSPEFTTEDGSQNAAAFKQNKQFAKKGSYQTKLTASQEKQFRAWVAKYHVPFDPNEANPDYDMRGYWLAMIAGTVPPWDGEKMTQAQVAAGDAHFPDTYKTPYDVTFSDQSKYATSDNPYEWQGNDLVDKNTGKLIFGPKTGGKPLSQAGKVHALQAIAAANQTINGSGSFAIPLSLQIAQARAGTTQTTTDDVKVADEIKQYAENQIKNHKLAGQALIDALNAISSANSEIQSQSDGFNLTLAEKKRHSLDLTKADRYHRDAAAKAQETAHGGKDANTFVYAPTFQVTSQAEAEAKAKRDFFHYRQQMSQITGSNRG